MHKTMWLGAMMVVAAVGVSESAGAAAWPQWRGPHANGVAPDADPPVTWSESEHVKWKFRIPGYGTSTPIVWGNQVFVVTAVAVPGEAGDAASGPGAGGATAPRGASAEAPATATATAAEGGEGSRRPGRRGGAGGGPGGGGGFMSETPSARQQFVVIAVDRATGKPLWQKVAREELPHEGHHRDHGFASFSPVTDGEWLFAYFGSRGLYAYDLAGNLKWEKDLGDMRTRNAFGEGGSMALHGDTLVVNWDHEGEDFIVALDKRTGRELWRQTRDEITTWTTPLVVEHEGKSQVVVSATGRVRGYDLNDGKVLWECGGMTQNVIPTPVADGGLVYAISGFRGAALLAIRLGQSGDLTDNPDAVAWKHGKNTPYVPSPLLYGDRLYFHGGNTGMFSSVDARTGSVVIDAERIPGLTGVYASPVGAAGRIYLTGRDGKSVVLKQGDKLEVLATNELEDKFDASPAAVGKELFLRGHQNLYCLAE